MAEYDDSIADVLKRTLHDVQELVRGEVALAKAEMRGEMRRMGSGVAALAVAAVSALIAVVFLLTAVAWAISTGFGWPAWTGFALVGAVVLIVAAVLGVVGRNRLTATPPMPRTMDTLKENAEWMKARTS